MGDMRKLVVFYSRQGRVRQFGQVLAARLDLPQDEQPIAYALFAHCFTCTKSIKAAVHIADALEYEMDDAKPSVPLDREYVAALNLSDRVAEWSQYCRTYVWEDGSP